MSTTDLPPWDLSIFSFDLSGSIEQCSNTSWKYWGRSDTNPLPSPPYYAMAYTDGYQPYRIQFNNTDATGEVRWIANLPLNLVFGVSMFDSKDYGGGVLERSLQMTSQAGCSVANPLKPSNLDVEVTGKMEQCQMVWVNVKNGTHPYKLEITPVGRPQKTIRFDSSHLGFVLDISAGVDYWLVVSDSAGNSAVKGRYNVSATSDIACLTAAPTIKAGRQSILYPGGTNTFGSGATATSVPAPSNRLAKPTIIGIASAVAVVCITLTVLLVWYCCIRSRRRGQRETKLEIEPAEDDYHQTPYIPVSIGETDYHDVTNIRQYDPPALTPYPLSLTSMNDRNTAHALGDTRTSEPSAITLPEKRRHLVNPDIAVDYPKMQNLSLTDTELSNPSFLPGSSREHSELPVSPPAYSAS
ncbi:unnamed protein product [Rhizoctonia solani]|uniref:Uncharacterized protein n=1 Tax=Rhizoctonia solani TaxID=456999 RepID=A0A8H3BF57_9AGAM|nr:unnamed protein product [Rhizoctonia solani]